MKTIDIAKISVLGALVTVATIVFQIPTPATRGYINLGDTFIFVGAILLGGRSGLFIGGIGSALADILSGYAHWAPFTLLIKGLEGYVAGFASPIYKEEKVNYLVSILVLVGASIVMVGGYFIVEVFMYGFGAALAELPGNMFQGGASIVISIVILITLKKAGIKL